MGYLGLYKKSTLKVKLVLKFSFKKKNNTTYRHRKRIFMDIETENKKILEDKKY